MAWSSGGAFRTWRRELSGGALQGRRRGGMEVWDRGAGVAIWRYGGLGARCRCRREGIEV